MPVDPFYILRRSPAGSAALAMVLHKPSRAKGDILLLSALVPLLSPPPLAPAGRERSRNGGRGQGAGGRGQGFVAPRSGGLLSPPSGGLYSLSRRPAADYFRRGAADDVYGSWLRRSIGLISLTKSLASWNRR